MKARSILAVVKCLCGWGTVLLFLVLLTLVFSFLGTIICAVLAGMMMGAAKPSKWVSVPLSALFPGVICASLRATRAEVSGHQILLLSLLCFGAYWLTYLVTSLTGFFERKAGPKARGAPVGAGGRCAGAGGREGTEGGQTGAAGGPDGGLSLQALQGQWSREMAGLDEEALRKTLDIAADRLTLSVVGPRGQISVLGEGRVRLECTKPLPELGVASAGGDADGESMVSI